MRDQTPNSPIIPSTRGKFGHRAFIALVFFLSACTRTDAPEVTQIGQFNVESDLYLAHFDLKTDVDDLYSVAGVATMLADPRFENVRYHAVAGAYGIQEGLYVPGNEVFEMAFGDKWSDAHANFDTAVDEVASLVIETLEAGGSTWIADGGQSDFSAAVVRVVNERHPNLDTNNNVHVVQHADWNEEVTAPENLAFVKEAAMYHRIPDGNGPGNGTPGFRSDDIIDWRGHVQAPRLINLWKRAMDLADMYNGVDGRYLNTSIQKGGLDFSDVSETTWIFGFNVITDANDFLAEFATPEDAQFGFPTEHLPGR